MSNVINMHKVIIHKNSKQAMRVHIKSWLLTKLLGIAYMSTNAYTIHMYQCYKHT